MANFFKKIGREFKRVVNQFEKILDDGKEYVQESASHFRTGIEGIIQGYDNYPQSTTHEASLSDTMVEESVTQKKEGSGTDSGEILLNTEPSGTQPKSAAEEADIERVKHSCATCETESGQAKLISFSDEQRKTQIFSIATPESIPDSFGSEHEILK